jgi:hypothetical protein
MGTNVLLKIEEATCLDVHQTVYASLQKKPSVAQVTPNNGLLSSGLAPPRWGAVAGGRRPEPVRRRGRGQRTTAKQGSAPVVEMQGAAENSRWRHGEDLRARTQTRTWRWRVELGALLRRCGSLRLPCPWRRG